MVAVGPRIFRGIGRLKLRGEITRDGLFMALGFVLAVTGLVGCVLGLIVGPSDQATVFALLGGFCLLMLAGFAYMRRHPGDAAAVEASRAAQQSERIGGFWAVMLAGSIAAAILVQGSSRGVWIFVASISGYQLVMWARRRRAP
jgi:hypothetical protein